jgi:syntaxin 16
MATRNLTKKFIELRSAAKASRNLGMRDESDGESGLLKNNNEAEWRNNRHTLPPEWVERIEVVEEDITKIKSRMTQLSALHSKRLMVNFETDELQQEREIEAKTREITDIFHHAEGILKSFNKKSEDPNISAAERTLRKNIQMNMAKRLQNLGMTFRANQKQYMGRLNSQKQGGSSTLDYLTESEKKVAAGEFVDQGFTVAQMTALEDVEQLVNERDEEITKIAKSIEELASIFKELAVLVIDQGTILDRIDYNMENAVEHAKEGIKHLEKAEENQKNAMSVKCIILLVVLIAIMVGILAWKHSGK